MIKDIFQQLRLCHLNIAPELNNLHAVENIFL